MKHELPNLDYTLDALAPHISAETMDFHYNKHLQAYADNLNKLIENTEFANKALIDIVREAPRGPIYNNAAQLWNHTFFFDHLAAAGTTKISKNFEKILAEKWGSLEKFQEEFTAKALANFGSGWTWLAKNHNGELVIINTDDADTVAIEPLFTPILGVDIWEHAYYIDYRNNRKSYLENFWKVVNWEKVEQNFNA